MAKKPKEKEPKKPEGTGAAAFREHLQKLVKRDVEEDLQLKTEFDVYSSGSIVIDHILGVKGFVRGTFHEIAGEAHSGKSTLCLQVARNVQRAGGSVAYLNPEQAMDLKYAKALGVDTEDKSKWFYSTENSYETLPVIMNTIITVGNFDLIIIDSVTAIKEEAVLNSAMDNKSSQLGVAARFWSDYAPKLSMLAHRNKTLILGTNQTRVANIGVYGSSTFKDTTGGNALKYYKTTSIHLKGSKPKAEEAVDEFGDKYYHITEDYTKVMAVVDKNKWAPGNKSAIGRIVPYMGYDNFDALFKLALNKGILQAAGPWISYGNESDDQHFKVQGRDAAYNRIKNNPALVKKLVEDLGLAKPENYFPNIEF